MFFPCIPKINVTSNNLFNPEGPPPSTEAILKLINETDGPMVDRNLSSLGKQQANILKDQNIKVKESSFCKMN